MIDGQRSTGQLHTIPLGMAGQLLQLCTDSATLAEITGEFFPATGLQTAREVRADLTLCVRERRGISRTECSFPVFRGRNEYVHADYGKDGSVWFDLKARAVSGFVSEELLADAGVFRRTVLAVIAGVLAPALSVVGLHAGCVVRNGKAVLLAAASGAGKSTLTLALALRGWSLLSDDWTFVADTPNGLRAWGMLTTLKLLPDAVRYFPSLSTLSPAPALNGEMSFEIDPWSFFRVDRAVDSSPASIVLLERGSAAWSGSHRHLSPSDADEIQTTLFKEIEEQPAGISQQDNFQSGLIQRISALPAFRVCINRHPEEIAADLDLLLMEQICG